ncbi:MAG: aminotransferase class I/II-fold pyridoxal phosphate-dependent enzyme [Gemmatimonadota bacterium]|nr:MAG: aminotransferase class I/II-fold pyridoxal phosphate-dependent enzyme [Gemmatimonadota bacterium]
MPIFEKCYTFTRAREVMAAGYYPYFVPIEGTTATESFVGGKRKIMVGSNNYLGLTHHPCVIEAAQAALKKYGSGCTGSRFLNGNMDLHELLESRLAEFIGTEAALVFSTGYQTNLGVIGTLVGRSDRVYLDKLDHASIVDASRLAYGEVARFKHGDLENLRRQLEANVVAESNDVGHMVVVDGVFSMEGDIADVPRLVELCEEFGAALVVDDAHAIGYLGPTGAGTAEHFGLTDRVPLTIGTFSKSFASIGGFVAGPESVIHYLRHHARSLIFSASMPPAAVATVLAALEVIQKEPERRERLWQITHRMMDGFRSLGFEIGPTETPIIPIMVGPMEKTFIFWKEVFDAGVFTNPVMPPAVPENSCRLRTSYIAEHTDDQLDFVLETFEQVGKKLAVI